MSALNSWVVAIDKPWQEWVLSHVAWNVAERVVILITIDFFIRQLTIQVVLVEGESEWELHIVGQLTLKLIESFHLYYQDAWHYSKY